MIAEQNQQVTHRCNVSGPAHLELWPSKFRSLATEWVGTVVALEKGMTQAIAKRESESTLGRTRGELPRKRLALCSPSQLGSRVTEAGAARWAPELFLDAAHDLMVRGNFDDGMRLVMSCLNDAAASLDFITYRKLCRHLREHHPIVNLLARSSLVRAIDALRSANPDASPYQIWSGALGGEGKSSDDIVGQAIDSYLRCLALADESAWPNRIPVRGFLECFFRLEFS